LVSAQSWLLKSFKSLVKMEGSAIENIFKSSVMSSNLGLFNHITVLDNCDITMAGTWLRLATGDYTMLQK
jgi:hypothetical protein